MAVRGEGDLTAPQLQLPSPLSELHDERLDRAGVRLWLKREDLIHPALPGNKWRKLKYNLRAASEQGYDTMLTFGGAYSNHIRATAAAGHYFGFETIGVIRGEEHLPLNSTLDYASRHGMRLTYMDRATYRRKSDPEVIAHLHEEWGRFYLVPEGGSNDLAVRGCMEIPREIDIEYDVICCACGTGGTLAGVAAALPPERRAIGFSALKGGDFLRGEVDRFQRDAIGASTHNWTVETEFHFGGFAKKNQALDEFIREFEHRHGLQLDWVYVAKMMYGIFALLDRGEFPAGTRIVALVTG